MPSIANPILLLDKHGILSQELISYLLPHKIVVLVSNQKMLSQKQLITIPYGKRIPRIPNNQFSHIIVVDISESNFEDFLPALNKKAKQSDAHIYVVKSIYDLTEGFLKIFRRNQTVGMSLLLYGDVFSDHVPYDNAVQDLITRVAHEKPLRLANSGVDNVYPLFDKDRAQLIARTIFADLPGGIYALFSPDGMTELTIARIFHQRNPELSLDLQAQKASKPTSIIPQDAVKLVHDLPSINKRFVELDLKKVKRIDGQSPNQIKHGNNNHLFSFFPTLGFFLALGICLLTIPLVFALIGKSSLQLGMAELEKGQLAQAAQSALTAQHALQLAQGTNSSWLLLADMLGQKQKVETVTDKISTAEQTSLALQNVITGAQLLGEMKNKKDSAIQAFAHWKFAAVVLSELIAEKKLEFLPHEQQVGIINMTNEYSNLAESLPYLMGVGKEKKYLLLFENNNELRPGGGFIGSYADVVLKDGILQSLDIHDVYDADGHLQGHVDPPEALKRYAGVQHWFLRDSNFSVNQKDNAGVESYFYNLETGKTVDGIVTLDTTFLKNLLQMSGSVRVLDYNQTVDTNNFFQITEDHAEKNFFPGSQQKQSFLRSFEQALQAKVIAHPLPVRQVVTFLQSALHEKHLTFAVNALALQDMVNNAGFFSSESVKRGNQNEIRDIFAVNEANIGSNKVNHYVQRSFQQLVTIDANGGVNHTEEIRYANTSTPNSPYGGDYKVFLRFLLPVGAVVTNLKIDGKDQASYIANDKQQPLYKGKTFLPSDTVEILTEDHDAYTTYGFYLIVPVQKTSLVSLTYALPDRLDISKRDIRYSALFLKQPGTDADPIHLEIKSDGPYTLKSAQPMMTVLSTKDLSEQFLLESDSQRFVTISH